MSPRLWAWPAVSGDLTPPGPAFYLTWPAWAHYCQLELGEESHPSLTPIVLEDPPNFLPSLRSLLTMAREGGPALPETPFHCPEIRGIREALLGHNLASLTPDHLILALGHLARQEAKAARVLAQKAIFQKADLFKTLTEAHFEPSILLPPTDQPDPSPKLATAWLNLARPYLRAGDLLWPAYGVRPDFQPMEGLDPDESGLFPWPGSA
jgi:hypothetical protein